MVKLNVRDRESIQEAVRRFRKLVERSGIKKEMRRREYYEKPSETRRRARLAPNAAPAGHWSSSLPGSTTTEVRDTPRRHARLLVSSASLCACASWGRLGDDLNLHVRQVAPLLPRHAAGGAIVPFFERFPRPSASAFLLAIGDQSWPGDRRAGSEKPFVRIFAEKTD